MVFLKSKAVNLKQKDSEHFLRGTIWCAGAFTALRSRLLAETSEAVVTNPAIDTSNVENTSSVSCWRLLYESWFACQVKYWNLYGKVHFAFAYYKNQ